jgi:Glycosyl transferase family 2
MHTPKVTFVVPCYKLAHLLSECLTSILAQSYRNFEVLVMDDCSPDDTAEVARSFLDPRVKHIRNEPNLGHLRNYNKGFDLAQGEYIWLVSADDRLRTPYVLERYLEVMEANRRVGYAFCPGVGLRGDQETGIVKWATLDEPDTILDGRTFLQRLLRSNCILAAAGLVRKECYERVGVFPLDLPFAGDWFLWCAIALHYDVAYFAEPMVNYREHSHSMTDTLIADDIRLLSKDDFAVRWRMKEKIEQAGDDVLAQRSRSTIVEDYIHSLTSKNWRGAKFRMSLQEFDESLRTYAHEPTEREGIRRQVLAGVARHLYFDSELATDLQLYELAIQHGGPNPKLWLQYAILRWGRFGILIMRTVSTLRASARRQQTKVQS